MHLNLGKYFEDNYIGKRLPNGSRRIPLFPIRLWNVFTRVIDQQPRTNNCVEGWHNGFQSSLSYSHPTIGRFLTSLQREQSFQEANLAKWEAGEMKPQSKTIKMRNEIIQNLVSDYANRDTLGYLRGIAHNFDF